MKNLFKRIICLLTVVALTMVCFVGCEEKPNKSVNSNSNSGSNFPNKSINMIVGYGAGGSTDIFARLVAKYLEQKWNVSVVVNNVTGGSGAVGFTQALQQTADGYTVTISNGASLTLSESGNVDWKYNDFDNLAKMIDEDEVLLVSKDCPYNSLEEFIEAAKANPKSLSVGFAGLGGFTHLAAAKFINDMGIEVNNIGYNSGSEAVVAVLGGFVDFCQQQPAEFAAQFEAGELKALGIMSKERHPSELLSGIPTSKEQGIDFLVSQWRGISAPKGLPEDVRKIWEDTLAEIAADPEFQKEVEETLLSRVNCITGEEFESFMDSEAAWIAPLLKELGMTAK